MSIESAYANGTTEAMAHATITFPTRTLPLNFVEYRKSTMATIRAITKGIDVCIFTERIPAMISPAALSPQ